MNGTGRGRNIQAVNRRRANTVRGCGAWITLLVLTTACGGRSAQDTATPGGGGAAAGPAAAATGPGSGGGAENSAPAAAVASGGPNNTNMTDREVLSAPIDGDKSIIAKAGRGEHLTFAEVTALYASGTDAENVRQRTTIVNGSRQRFSDGKTVVTVNKVGHQYSVMVFNVSGGSVTTVQGGSFRTGKYTPLPEEVIEKLRAASAQGGVVPR